MANCETCAAPIVARGARLCDPCWELEHRLADYLKTGGQNARAFVLGALGQTSGPFHVEQHFDGFTVVGDDGIGYARMKSSRAAQRVAHALNCTPEDRVAEATVPVKLAPPVSYDDTAPGLVTVSAEWARLRMEETERLRAEVAELRSVLNLVNEAPTPAPEPGPLDPEVEERWRTFWAPIVVKDGVLDIEQVKCELFDFSVVMRGASKVYDHITGSRISKPNTDPDAVISVADEREQERWEEYEKEVRTDVREECAAEAEAWKETAAMYGRNADYYRGLLVQIGEGFGVAAGPSDDGSVQADVLVAKVPELVADLRRGGENTVSGTVCVNRAFWEQMKADRMALREAAKKTLEAIDAFASEESWAESFERLARDSAALRKAVGE